MSKIVSLQQIEVKDELKLMTCHVTIPTNTVILIETKRGGPKNFTPVAFPYNLVVIFCKRILLLYKKGAICYADCGDGGK